MKPAEDAFWMVYRALCLLDKNMKRPTWDLHLFQGHAVSSVKYF